jgi:hypothetical protein
VIQAFKELRYRAITQPQPPDNGELTAREHAHDYWKRAKEVALHAASDDPSDTDGEEDMTGEQLEAYRQQRRQSKKELDECAKLMDLQYWLEMIDQKHRYGSNLHTYHTYWKKSDTHQNFFYWLDEGDGKRVELPNVTRERLEQEQVRYLSREERQNYLVRVDSEGKICWAKNGERVSTSPQFRDSVEGVVPETSDAITWHAHKANVRPLTSSATDTDDSIEAQHYGTGEFKKLPMYKKLIKVSPALILNQLLRKTIKPNTWIYVADTSFHLYIGIKQSGTFQHSSFMQGARIVSAGLIKIKDGQIRKMSPLSGHYRPPAKNFKLFVHSLHEAGVDLSHVSKSRSYAILVGLETYANARAKVKHGLAHIGHAGDHLIHPSQKKKEEGERAVKPTQPADVTEPEKLAARAG